MAGLWDYSLRARARKEHGSSLTIPHLHLILLNFWNTLFPREEADLLHQNNSGRDNQNDSSFCLLGIWAKYWCLPSPRVLLLAVSSNLLPWVFPIKAMLYYNLCEATHKLFPVHTSLFLNYLKFPTLPNPRACVDTTCMFTQTLCGRFFPQKPLYLTAMRWEGQVFYYALTLPGRELKPNTLKWLIQDHISSQQKSPYKKLESYTSTLSFHHFSLS